jgi:hypothetical protein
LPAVRKAKDETLIIASGFSCHEQIVQQTKSRPLHIAEVLKLAMAEGTVRPPEPPKAAKKSKPEAVRVSKAQGDGEHDHQVEQAGRLVANAGTILAGLAGAYLFARKKKHEKND